MSKANVRVTADTSAMRLPLPPSWVHHPRLPEHLEHEAKPHYDAAGKWVCHTCREPVKLT